MTVNASTYDAWLANSASGLTLSVEALAADLGVTKGGFYGQFPDRQALLEALLQEWERQAVDAVVARDDLDPRAAIIWAGAMTFSRELLPVDLAIRTWGRTDKMVERGVRRVDERRLAHLRLLFGRFVDDPDEVEARSVLAFSLMIGQHFLLARHPGRTRKQVVTMAAAFLLR